MPIVTAYTLPAAKTADFLNNTVDLTPIVIQDRLPGRTGLLKDVIFIAEVTVTGTTEWDIVIKIAGNTVATKTAVIADGTYALLAGAVHAQVSTSQGLCTLPLDTVGTLQIDFSEESGTGSIDTAIIYMCWPDNG